MINYYGHKPFTAKIQSELSLTRFVIDVQNVNPCAWLTTLELSL
jgi:hypothetical protein